MRLRQLQKILTICVIGIAPVSAALGQDTTTDGEYDSVLEEVITTGTRVQGRSVDDSPVAIDVISLQDLEQATTLPGELGEMLQALVPAFNFPRQSNSGGADHVRAAQLRGMSPDQTLVLVNGKRRHISSMVNLGSKVGKGTTPVDFNTIPSNSLKRVEVLRDGAGAQYGSDAIAGVVNLVLKDGDEGGQIGLTYGFNSTDFDPRNESITDGETVYINGDYGFSVGSGGFFRFGGEYRNRNSTNRGGFDLIPPWEANTPDNDAVRGQVNYAPGDGETEDYNLFFNTAVPFGSEGNEFYSFGTYAHRDSEGANFFRYPDGWDNVKSIYPMGFMPISIGENNDGALNAGFRGDLGEWSWDVSIGYGRNNFDYDLINSLNTSFGVASETEFDAFESRYSQTVFNADIVRSFAMDSIDALNLATGIELRNENYKTKPGSYQSYAAGPEIGKPVGVQAGPGLSPDDAADISRNVAGIYLDIEMDITERFLVGVATRYEDFEDFGSALTGKLASRFDVSDNITLRGAISNSFRSPSLPQQGFQTTTTNFGDGGKLVRIVHLPASDPIAQALGASDLTEETSSNISAGIVWSPTDSFQFTLDFFQIKVDDRITVSERISGFDIAAVVPGIADIEGVTYFTNAVDTQTEGFDAIATYTRDLGPGILSLTGAYTYAKNEIRHIDDTPQVLIDLGWAGPLVGVEEQNTLESAAPRDKLILSANWLSDRYSVMLRASQFGETTRVFNFGGGFHPEQTYGKNWALDTEVQWQATDSFSVAVGAANLLDEYPELSDPVMNYFDNLPYDVITPIGTSGRYLYARVGFQF